MKTTFDIPDAALADAMRYTGAKTKRKAVVKALESHNRQQRVQDLVASFGTWEIATNDEIQAGDLAEIAGRKGETKTRTTALACLRVGVNVSLGDVLVFACATRHGVELPERDRHFAMICKAVQS